MLNTKSFCFSTEAAGTQLCAAVPATRVFTKATAMKPGTEDHLWQATPSLQRSPGSMDLFVASSTICLTLCGKPLLGNSFLQSHRAFCVLKRQVLEKTQYTKWKQKASFFALYYQKHLNLLKPDKTESSFFVFHRLLETEVRFCPMLCQIWNLLCVSEHVRFFQVFLLV